MKTRHIFPAILVGFLAATTALSAADPRTAFDAQVGNVIATLNREAQADTNGPALLAELIQREYGTPVAELNWAVRQSLSWGEITALAYIRRTTGRSFETLVVENARGDFWAYAEKSDMRSERMAHSLESFLKTAKKERNTRIFEKLRASRRVQPMPDLGSGFGLFQEALDFRRIDSPRPTKVHTVGTGNAKGNQ